MIKSKFLNTTTDFFILLSTVLLYLTSRIDANIFKSIFIILFISIVLRKVARDFKFDKNIFFFFMLIVIFICREPEKYIQNLFTIIYFFIILSTYYYYFIKNDLLKIVTYYIYFATFIAFLGLLQEVLFLINSDYLFYLSKDKNPDFLYGSTFHLLRIASLLDEPSKLGLYLLPAILFGFGKYIFKIKELKISKLNFLIIFIAFVLTFSAHAFLSFLIAYLFLLFYIKTISKKIKLSLIFLFIISIPFIVTIDVVMEKVINTGIFSGEIDIHTSTAATSAFFYVASQCMLTVLDEVLLFGVGMGNYNLIAFSEWQEIGIKVLNDDGSTIGYSRIIIEFGIIGFLLFIYFMYKNIIKDNKNELDYLKAIFFINSVSFIFIIVVLFRMGFYINPPTIFFLALFIVSKIKYYKFIKMQGII